MTQLIVPELTKKEFEHAAAQYLRSLPPEHFMEATPQSTQRKITLESLDLLQVRRADVQVFSELLVQYPMPGRLGQVVPDNMIVLSEKPIRAKGSFNTPKEPAGPFVVLEYISTSSERKDYEDNFRLYEVELRVPYCIHFHPEKHDLRVYRHGGRRYRRLRPNNAGRCSIPELDLEIGILNGWMRFWHRGELLELPADLVRKLDAKDKALAEAEAELTRLRELVAQLQRGRQGLERKKNGL